MIWEMLSPPGGGALCRIEGASLPPAEAARGGEYLCPLGWVPTCGHSSGPRVVAHGPSQLAWNSPGVTPLFAAGPAAGRPAPTGPGSSASDALLPAVTLLLPPRCPGGLTYFLPRTPTR